MHRCNVTVCVDNKVHVVNFTLITQPRPDLNLALKIEDRWVIVKITALTSEKIPNQNQTFWQIEAVVTKQW